MYPTRPTTEKYLAVQQSEEFGRLRNTLRGFIFPMTVAFFLWYALYVLLSAYARGFMSTKLVGNINVALVFGLLQFVSTFLIAWLYSRYAAAQARPARRQDQAPSWKPKRVAQVDGDPLPRGRGVDLDQPHAHHHAVPGLRRDHPGASPSGPAGRPRPPPTSTPAAGRSPASRTAWRSAATTCRRRPSWASPASSRSTATTASCTRSASWSPGWSRCCWSPSSCATRAGTRWPTCWRSGCGSARCAPRRASPPSWCRSST